MDTPPRAQVGRADRDEFPVRVARQLFAPDDVFERSANYFLGALGAGVGAASTYIGAKFSDMFGSSTSDAITSETEPGDSAQADLMQHAYNKYHYPQYKAQLNPHFAKSFVWDKPVVSLKSKPKQKNWIDLFFKQDPARFHSLYGLPLDPRAGDDVVSLDDFRGGDGRYLKRVADKFEQYKKNQFFVGKPPEFKRSINQDVALPRISSGSGAPRFGAVGAFPWKPRVVRRRLRRTGVGYVPYRVVRSGFAQRTSAGGFQ